MSKWDNLESIVTRVETVPGSGDFPKGARIGMVVDASKIEHDADGTVSTDGNITEMTSNGDGTYTLDDGTIWPVEETE